MSIVMEHRANPLIQGMMAYTAGKNIADNASEAIENRAEAVQHQQSAQIWGNVAGRIAPMVGAAIGYGIMSGSQPDATGYETYEAYKAADTAAMMKVIGQAGLGQVPGGAGVPSGGGGGGGGVARGQPAAAAVPEMHPGEYGYESGAFNAGQYRAMGGKALASQGMTWEDIDKKSASLRMDPTELSYRAGRGFAIAQGLEPEAQKAIALAQGKARAETGNELVEYGWLDDQKVAYAKLDAERRKILTQSPWTNPKTGHLTVDGKEALRRIDQRMAGFQKGALPRRKKPATPQDLIKSGQWNLDRELGLFWGMEQDGSPFFHKFPPSQNEKDLGLPPGTGMGHTWYHETGALLTRDTDGMPKVLVEPRKGLDDKGIMELHNGIRDRMMNELPEGEDSINEEAAWKATGVAAQKINEMLAKPPGRQAAERDAAARGAAGPAAGVAAVPTEDAEDRLRRAHKALVEIYNHDQKYPKGGGPDREGIERMRRAAKKIVQDAAPMRPWDAGQGESDAAGRGAASNAAVQKQIDKIAPELAELHRKFKRGELDTNDPAQRARRKKLTNEYRELKAKLD
jgi:hypothetical protein